MQVAVIHTAFEDTPRTVAFVDVPDGTDAMDACEYAYRWTNNVMGSWSIKEKTLELSNGETMENGDYNDAVTVMAPLHEGGMGLRSTSMGDQMLVGNKKYKVAMFGFEAV
jgi:hypothetical protein